MIALTLIAAALRFTDLTAQSLWFDEGIAWNAANQPTLAGVVLADPTNPPLYFLLLHAGTRFTGDELLALRWFSAAMGVLLIPLVYRLARRLAGFEAGGYAAALAAFSPLLWWSSQEIRMYALMALLVTLAATAWHELVVAPSRRAWWLLWGAEVMLLYTHSTGPVAVLWLNVVTAAVWLVRRRLVQPDARTWLAGQAGVALAWSPWAITRFILLPGSNQVVAAAPVIEPALFAQLWQGLWAGPWALVGKEPQLVVLSAVLAVFAVLLVALGGRTSRWLALHALVYTAGLLLALTVVALGVHARYLVALVPLVLVALAGGIARLGGLRGRVGRIAPALALTPFLATSVFAIYTAGHNPAYAHDDVAGLVQYYAATLGPGDTVLAWAYTDDRYDLAYYWPRMGVRAQRVILPEGAPPGEVLLRLPQHGAVALNVWFTQRAGQSGMLDCVLAHGTENEPVDKVVYGMSTRVYASPARSQPTLEPLDATFTVAHVTAAGARSPFTAAQALCLPVRIALAEPTTQDLKAGVILKNSLGWEIARNDVVFVRGDGRTSRQVAPGDVLTAYPLLRLPYGAPAGDYTVVLRLYDPDHPSGYDVLGGAGTPAGKDLVLGTWTALPGADWSRVTPATSLPQAVGLPAAPQLTLRACDTGDIEVINNGSRLRVSLLWQGTGALPVLTLAAADGTWQVEAPPAAGAHEQIALDWREVRVPADAGSGVAELRLPGGAVIASYAVEALPAAFVPPDFTVPVDASLPGIGVLAGFTLGGDTFDRTQPVAVMLAWRASDDGPATNYKVFVHLVSSDGRLIAQSDAFPAAGARPTTGWRAGEYIVDEHQVVFHADATPGPATFYVGLYDPETMVRARFADGTDAVALPADVTIR